MVEEIGRYIEFDKPVLMGSVSSALELIPKICRYHKEKIIAVHIMPNLYSTGYHTVAIGNSSRAVYETRDIYRPIYTHSQATMFLLAHNHPYESHPIISESDVALTHNLLRAGPYTGIYLLDHIVVGDKRSYSFRAEGSVFPRTILYAIDKEYLEACQSKELRSWKGGFVLVCHPSKKRRGKR